MTNDAPDPPPPWWKTSTVYQIFPSCFMDSNDDGMGDIPGIISKLDYIKGVGAEAIWISPIYESPQIDMGYDISNYQGIHPPYGTMEDIQKLIDECHSRDMHILFDLVISHTSDQHPWFQESKSSKENPKRDWYIWRPAKYDDDGNRQPPNNWKSVFGEGSAWQWDESTEEYYLHLFTKQQPDLNWDSAEMRKKIGEEAISFWLDKGVDGFRIDAVNMYSKPEGLPDAPIKDPESQFQPVDDLVCNGPRVHEYIAEITDILRSRGAVSAGEIAFTGGRDDVLQYASAKEKQLDMVFQFDGVGVGMGTPRKYDVTPKDWNLPELAHAIAGMQDILVGSDAWSAVFFESHDQGRSISRFCSDAREHRVASGKLLATMQATLSGTLYLYQGQEIGMVNMAEDFPIEEITDVESKNYVNFMADRSNGDQPSIDRAAAAVRYLSRDNARMPVSWNGDEPYGGFSTKEPPVNIHPLTKEINVAAQEGDPGSILSFWKKALKLRKEYAELFIFGDFAPVQLDHQCLFIYQKTKFERTALVILNFSDHDVDWKAEDEKHEIDLGYYQLLFSTLSEADDVDENRLLPFEGRVYCTS